MKTQSENKYGKEIRSVRAYLGHSQEKMAEMLGISVATLSNYERGKYIPPADIWERVQGMRQAQTC